MFVQIGRGQTVRGINVPAGSIFVDPPPDLLSLLQQGGDATLLAGLAGSGVRSVTARFRAFGNVDVLAGTFGAHMSGRAPGHYDGIRVGLHGAANSGVNAFTVSVCAPASMLNGYIPRDSAGANLALTPVTWGASNLEDTRSVGGQATTLIQNSSGAGATLIEGDVLSDYIPVRSVPRTDLPGALPLFCLRQYGVNPPMVNATEADAGGANPFTSVHPDFMCGYWAGNHTATPAPGEGAPNQQWMPSVSIIFYLRGAVAVSLHCASDSIEQGWIGPTAVPQFGGLINGWPQKLVRLLNLAGINASFSNGALTGSKSFPFHERAYNALMTGGLTHLLVKPWSVNELPDGVASVAPALARTTRLLELARRKGVVATVIRPWAGQSIDSAPGVLVQAYCDQLAASGGRVFDARSVVADPMNGLSIAPQYLTRTAGGAAADPTHLNEACQDAVASYAFSTRGALGIF